MSLCPYTWVRQFFGLNKMSTGDQLSSTREAEHLRVSVIKNNITTVDVALPSRSARWLIELIPEDVVIKIKEEGIPLEKIQEDLAQCQKLVQSKIFELKDENRKVLVWLE